MIVLFTDFGYEGPYVGQVKTALAGAAPGESVIDLMHDAPAHDPCAAAYLLAALVPHLPARAVCLAVVDPGVGGPRLPVAVEADGRWFVGPGNGLFEPLQRRAETAALWLLAAPPAGASPTFHGRDLFAPVAARLARGLRVPGEPAPEGWRKDPRRPGADWPDDRAVVVYVDRFGNCMTGLRGATVPAAGILLAGGARIARAGTFADVPVGAAFWYVNSSGLVEIAVNRDHAAHRLGLDLGSEVTIAPADGLPDEGS